MRLASLLIASVAAACQATASASPVAGKNLTLELPGKVPLELNGIPELKSWVGRYEVTQVQYEAVMGNNPSQFKAPTNPVDTVSWHEAIAFCTKLTSLLRENHTLSGELELRLPWEKEWNVFVSDAKLSDAVHQRWDPKKGFLGPKPVGSLAPNSYGLYDVRGNVFEWCLDWFNDKQKERVLRGGSWLNNIDYMAVEYRTHFPPDYKHNVSGFRVILTPTSEHPQ